MKKIMPSTSKESYKNKKLTVEEYFALEEELDQKFEYVNGEIIDMAGVNIKHSLISTSTTASLDNATREKTCIVLNSNAKLYIKHINSYFYPDAMVVYDKDSIFKNHVQNPEIIIEVLSPSTEGYDHGKKFAFYRLIETLKTYIMLHQNKPLAEVYQRNPDNSWLLKEYLGLEQVIDIDDNVQLAMADLYRQVNLENN